MKPIAKLDRYDALSLGSLLGTVALTAMLWSKLPATMPIHFNALGEVDGQASKSFAAWFLPGTAAAVLLLLRGVGLWILPTSWRTRFGDSPVSQVTFLLVVFFSLLHGVVLMTALNPAASSAALLFAAIGAFFAAIGLVLPRVRRNPFIGVRTAWALTSDENWRSTHRVAGASFFVAGAAIVVLALTHQYALVLPTIVVALLLPAGHSYIHARRTP